MAARSVRRIDRVGLLAAVGGGLALALLPFGRLRAFRLASGEPLALSDALPIALAALPLVMWAGVALASFISARSRQAALVRGLLGGAIVVALVWLSNEAAQRALPGSGTFARYSMGAGVWVAVFFALTLVIDARRPLGGGWLSAAVVAVAPLGLVALVLTGGASSLGMAAEYRNVSGEFWLWAGQHIVYSAVAMAVAIVLGVSLGILAYRNRRFAEPVFTATSIVQTIPGLAMVGVLAVPLGLLGGVPFFRSLGIGIIGWAPVVVALTLYALLVLVRNTYVGLSSVPEPTIEAGRGMGMSGLQLLRKVELPLASPIMFSGTRTAFQQTIGNATLAYFVAAGSLGRPIFSGVSQQSDDLVLLGSVALVALALTTDLAMRAVERLVTPRRTQGGGR